MTIARENPFQVARVRQFRYIFTEADWSTFFNRWRSHKCRGVIIGNHGSGKSTLLEDFAERLQKQAVKTVMVRLHRGERKLPAWLANFICINPDTTLLLDGLEQLAPIERLRLRFMTRNLTGLVATSHVPLLFPTIYRCESRLEIFERMVTELLPADWPPPPLALPDLYLRHAGNIREALLELYDSCAALPRLGGRREQPEAS